MHAAPAAPMRRRSWYLPAAVSDRFAEIIDDLHFRTRRPKHEVLEVAVSIAIEHEAEILDRLNARNGRRR
jgi:hypothetical protein